MAGILLRHSKARSEMVLVPVMSKPFPRESWKECPGCHLVHMVKTVHCLVNDAGVVMVSEGVLEDLKLAGDFDKDWQVIGSTDKPPPLHIGTTTISFVEQREKQDQAHRRITVGRR